jgi:hypothetical protein
VGSAIINSMHFLSFFLSVGCGKNYQHHLKPLNSLPSLKYIPYHYYHLPLPYVHLVKGAMGKYGRGSYDLNMKMIAACNGLRRNGEELAHREIINIK